MALRVYPVTIGFVQWQAWRAYSSDESPYGSVEFASTALFIPIRPIGVLLWSGRFSTPVYSGRDPARVTMRTLMESLDQGIHTLMLPVPLDQRQSGILTDSLTVQPISVEPTVRNARGIESGWTVDWIEVP